MSATLVDSDVLLDVLGDDPRWGPSSADALAMAADAGLVVINPLVYAEVSVAFDRIEDLDEALPVHEIARVPLPWEAGFLAAKAFEDHRRGGGGPTDGVLTDFYVGAHAAVEGWRLLTRVGAGRYRTWFPTVDVLTPRGA